MKQRTTGSNGKMIYTNNNFKQGMYYSNSPLPNGFVKALVNFDISASGDSLKPRQSYVTNEMVFKDPITDEPKAVSQYIPHMSRQDNRYVYYFGIPDKIPEHAYLNDTIISTASNVDNLIYGRSTYGTHGIQETKLMDISHAALALPKKGLIRVVDVQRLIDGDTLDLQIEGESEAVRCRLIGINTPEMYDDNGAAMHPPEKWANAAAQYLGECLKREKLYIEYDEHIGEDARSYNRRLIYLWADGSLVNAELLNVGLAEIDILTHNRFIKYFDQLVRFRDRAKRLGLGIHSPEHFEERHMDQETLYDIVRIEFLDRNPIEFIEVDYQDGISMLGRIIVNGEISYKGIILLCIRDGVVEVHSIDPYNPRINEVNHAGFNLLLDNPFNFNSYYGVEAIDNGMTLSEVLGVLAKEKSTGNILSQTTTLERVNIEAIVATPPVDKEKYQGYAVRWEYRSNTEENFTEAQEWTLAVGPYGDPLTQDALIMPTSGITGNMIDVRFSLGLIQKDVEGIEGDLYNPDILKEIYPNHVPDFGRALSVALSEKREGYSDDYIAFYVAKPGVVPLQYGVTIKFMFPKEDAEVKVVSEDGHIYIDHDRQNFFVVEVFNNIFGGTDKPPVDEYDVVEDSVGEQVMPVGYRIQDTLIKATVKTVIPNPTPETGLAKHTVQFGVLTGFRINAGYIRVVDELNKHLNLKNATRIAQFYRQTILYGGNIGDNILQFSAFEDPSYMPFPYGNIVIPEPIIHVHNHNDRLIVFGRENIYMLHGGQEPTTMTLSKIYSNLSIKDHEVRSVQSVGKDVYFLSENKAYLIQPNIYTSNAEEVRVIKISDPVERLLDNPREYIMNRLITHYQLENIKEDQLFSEDKIAFVFNNTIHQFVTYRLNDNPVELMVIYLYDTENRRWRLYDMIDGTSPRYIMVFDRMYLFNNTSVSHFEYKHTVSIPICIDTGYITIDPNHMKRFRNLVFRVNNPGGYSIPAMLDFRVDGVPRQIARQYKIIQDDTGEFIPATEYIENLVLVKQILNKFTVPGVTVLGDFQLDSSRLPRMENLEMRFGVSGRGKAPNFVLAATTSNLFELLSYGIIYKKKSV